MREFVPRVKAFIRENPAPFTSNEAAAYIFPKKKRISNADLRSLERVLEQHPDLFHTDDDLWYTKETILLGSSGRISLMPVDWALRGLVPGHRILPFPSGLLSQQDLQFELEDGTVLEKRFEVFNIEDVSDLILFLPLGMWGGLKTEGGPLGRSLELPVFDLAPVLPSEVDEGASLVFKALSPSSGRFSLRYVNGGQSTQEMLSMAPWDASLEYEMLSILREHHFSLIQPDVLLFKAIARLGDVPQGTPGQQLSNLLCDPNLFSLHRTPAGLVSLGLSGGSILQSTKTPNTAEPKLIESLDDICSGFELSVGVDDLSNLAYGAQLLNWDLDSFISRSFPDRVLNVLTQEELDMVQREMSKMMQKANRILERENWTEDKLNLVGTISQFYFSNIETLRWIDEAGIPIEDIPDELLICNAEISGILMSIFSMVIRDKGTELGEPLEHLLQIAQDSKKALQELVASRLSGDLR